MDPLVAIIALVIIVITAISILVNAKTNAFVDKLLIGLLITGIISICIVIVFWVRNSGEESLKYHYVGKIPFEYNPSDQEYYIYHQGNFKNSKEYVYGFSTQLLENPEYDSCYVYKVEAPVFLGLFTSQYWVRDYKYRQNKDILLQHRAIDKISIHEK